MTLIRHLPWLMMLTGLCSKDVGLVKIFCWFVTWFVGLPNIRIFLFCKKKVNSSKLLI